MNRTARIAIIAISIAVFCYAGLGHVLGQTHEERAYKSLTVYGEVLQKIQSDYVDEPNMHLVTAGALHGLLESLDPQSSYLTPREYTEYKQKLASTNPGDTGLTLSKRFGYIIVVSVLPESPAEKAGIRSGDIFESVAGFTTREMSVGQAMNLLRGQLDLRSCGRGPVSEGLAVARLFISSGNLATLKGQTVSAQTFAAEPGKVVWKGPVSVLTDGTTSGAAEVLASAIGGAHRGDIVGERTFGLASEQKLITIDDGSALILTVANYYNFDGKSILEEGVTPTEVVRQTSAAADDGADDDADSGQTAQPPAEPRPLSPEDAVYKKAVEMLKAPAKKAA
jgi:C-terminal processing protease CtpA/Prc